MSLVNISDFRKQILRSKLHHVGLASVPAALEVLMVLLGFAVMPVPGRHAFRKLQPLQQSQYTSTGVEMAERMIRSQELMWGRFLFMFNQMD